MPSSLAVAVTYTGLPATARIHWQENLFLWGVLVLCIFYGFYMHSLYRSALNQERRRERGEGFTMSTLIFGFLTLSAIPILLFCLRGFHCSSRKRVIAVTLLRPIPLSVDASHKNVRIMLRRPTQRTEGRSHTRVTVADGTRPKGADCAKAFGSTYLRLSFFRVGLWKVEGYRSAGRSARPRKLPLSMPALELADNARIIFFDTPYRMN